MKKQNIAVVTAVTMGAVSSAQAALPTGAADAVASISTFADDIIAAAWPIATTIVVATVGIKLFKKFANKAT